MFRYSEPVIERFPTIWGGVLHAQKVRNGPTPDDLRFAFEAEQSRAIERFGALSPAEVPSLAAWRAVFSGFGVKPTQYRNAAEALLRRLRKEGALPSRGLLVDLGNLVSIRYALPVAVFDRRGITGMTTVRFAEGDERFSDLASGEADHPEPGEAVFVDDAGRVSARRWCWRQSAETATRTDTAEVLITVEGHHAGAREDVTAATEALEQLLASHCPASQVEAALLSRAEPAFESRR